jgi:predicted transcriptional regulator
MNSQNVEQAHGYIVQDDRDDFNFIFVHKELDDFGLDPYSFRIYSRIVRRAGKGEAFESNKNMAIGCRMSEAQVKRSLKTLATHGLIIKESRPGTTCIYRVAPRRNWSKSIPVISEVCTDSSHRPTPAQVAQNGGVGLIELGGRSDRARGVGLTELQSNSLLNTSNKVNPSKSDGRKKKEEEGSKEINQEKALPDNHYAVKKEKISATNEQSTHEDLNSGAARENHSQILVFSDDPVKEVDFLLYYQTYQRSQNKDINSVAPYVAKVLSKNDEGSTEVLCLFEQWKGACRTLQRKINNFADDPAEVEKQRQRYDFPKWEAWLHDHYYSMLQSEGLSKFCKHKVSAKWYEWASAKFPERFVDIPD